MEEVKYEKPKWHIDWVINRDILGDAFDEFCKQNRGFIERGSPKTPEQIADAFKEWTISWDMSNQTSPLM